MPGVCRRVGPTGRVSRRGADFLPYCPTSLADIQLYPTDQAKTPSGQTGGLCAGSERFRPSANLDTVKGGERVL